MEFKKQIKKILEIVTKSYYMNYIVSAIFALLIRVTICLLHVETSSEVMFSTLNGIGVLTTFFLMSIQKNDFKKLIEFSKKDRRYRFEYDFLNNARMYEQGVLLKNTLFSYIILNILLIAVQYILMLFNIYSRYLILTSITLLMTGFIHSIIIWNYEEVTKD